MLSLKQGVLFEDISDEIVNILPVITKIYSRYGKTCVITSARDGRHMVGSKHYSGNALDLRTFFFTPTEKDFVLRDLQQALGSNFDVILESDHTHIEYDP